MYFDIDSKKATSSSIGSSFFAVRGILPWKAILLSNIYNCSMLMRNKNLTLVNSDWPTSVSNYQNVSRTPPYIHMVPPQCTLPIV